MKILVIYPYVPWPLDRGTFQRTFHLLKRIATRHDVDFVAFSEPDQSEDAKKSVFEEFCSSVEFLPFQHPEWQKLFPHRLLNPLPSNVQHWQQDEIAEFIDEKVESGSYDMVHLCDLVLMPYIYKHRDKVPFVVDRSRVDLQFQFMEHQNIEFSTRQKLLRYESYAKLWFYERKLAKATLQEIVCGPDDKTFIHNRVDRNAPVLVVANGVDLEYFHPDTVDDQRDEDPSIMFCGAMDYSPNVDALKWFFEDVYAQLIKRVPTLKILIVGRSPIPEIQAYVSLKGVTVTGGVPDVRPYYRRAWLQIVPLRIGGGTRLKIVESLAIGTPVVSTSIGAQGLDLEHGRQILLADDAAAFVDETVKALEDGALRSSLELEGLKVANERFGWPAIGDRLAAHYETLI